MSGSAVAHPYPAPLAENGGGPLRATLPGAGEAGPLCGCQLPVGMCWEHETPRVYTVAHRCRRRECPSCGGWCPGGRRCPARLPKGHSGGDWAHTEGAIAALKLDGLANGAPLAQVIVSAPPSLYREDGDHGAAIRGIRAHAIRFCRAISFHGERGAWGSLVVHLWRGCEADGYNTWGPHAHLVCPGVDVRKTEGIFARSGWVVKQATVRGGRFQLLQGASLFRHLVYELGHSAIVRGGHALTWWGRARDAEQIEGEVLPFPEVPTLKCECGKPLSRWVWWWELERHPDGTATFTDNFDRIWFGVTVREVER